MKHKFLIKTKYGSFNAIVWHDRADKIYLVKLLSFDKTMTQGSTVADAKYMARDCAELLCEVAFDDGKIVVDDQGKVAARGKLARISGPITVAV
ncbi:MAG: hypothetical protein HY001_00895 [Candidatus Portnoybacteria bacterium]|nr:hypothetical protein [Candidatus Portnoybacteria bacterium]